MALFNHGNVEMERAHGDVTAGGQPPMLAS
jgi:hypothetical protein